jgi:two-component system response regulator
LQVGKALRPDVPATDSERVEVLLIHNDPCAVRQVQDSLYESRIPSFLRVVSDADKAVACLRREGKYATVPRPNLILLGLPLDSRDGRAVLKAIRDDELLHAIPMVILAAPANSGAILAADGLKASLILSKPEDLSKVEDLLRSVHEMCQTVVESRKKPKG